MELTIIKLKTKFMWKMPWYIFENNLSSNEKYHNANIYMKIKFKNN